MPANNRLHGTALRAAGEIDRWVAQGKLLIVKAILFDLFETLVTEVRHAPRRASSLGSDLGIDDERFRIQWKSRRQAVILGLMSFPEALRDICASMPVCIDDIRLQQICEERIAAKKPAFINIETDIIDLLQLLKNRGIQLGVVSNCFSEDIQAWPSCRLFPFFDCCLFSFEVHLAKPDSRIYQESCKRLGAHPADTLFVADGIQDLLGAEQTGLCPVQARWFLQRWHNNTVPVYVNSVSTVKELLRYV